MYGGGNGNNSPAKKLQELKTESKLKPKKNKKMYFLATC